MCETIEESEDMDKLGQGFTSADPLEKVDLGDGTIQWIGDEGRSKGWYYS